MDQYIGKMLDNRYEILDVIGVGGMAVVYKAYCHRLNRFVAIKILKHDFAEDAEFRRRFHEEAQAVAMLSHANIVSVYDVSRGEDIDYIVMELIDGITLKQYMQRLGTVLGWQEALFFITQIVRALGHAHSRGIIHRDIKPQNIMVLRDGSVKVADFGIARVVSSTDTLKQEALGSVHYISPEQARGSHIDARADIYSVGVVLYEMLTNRLPFEGDTPVSIALQHISATPKAPRELNPDIPAALEEIIMKAMAPKLEQRYASAKEMLRDLEEFRKNPQVDFQYDAKSYRGAIPIPDEPTRKMDTPLSQPEPESEPVRIREQEPELVREWKKPPEKARDASRDEYRKPVREEPRREYDDYDDEEPEDDDTGNSRRGIIIPAVIIIFLIGLGLFLWITFFSGPKPQPQEELQTVPNLLGEYLDEVQKDSDITDHFRIVTVSTEYSDIYEEGQIINQSPVYGESAEDGSTISVIVSGGREYITMISLKDLTLEEALARLTEMRLEVDEITYQDSDTVSEGTVISSNPGMGDQLLPGDPVDLVVSSGPEIKKITVPKVTGQTESKAQEMLQAFGLHVANIIKKNSDEPAGQVIEQSLAPNTEVDEGTSISITVSSGPVVPEPVEPEEPQQHTKHISINLPDLSEDDTRENITVTVTVDGVPSFERTVPRGTQSLDTMVKGSGVSDICIYVDGQKIEQYALDFDS